jgi:hypothetical protein
MILVRFCNHNIIMADTSNMKVISNAFMVYVFAVLVTAIYN